ncbi:thioredoxin domain-containing protein [Streptacidiphilus sp. 4-A2]|nr:thioredoxin domain-containing protein [Streptacidiphilus sp. 4-A2]
MIVYGNPNAKNTLQVYEDFRCPICDELEKSAGPAIQALADKGTYKIEYHLATFLDGNLGGNGSAVALNAAAAALNESTAKFKGLPRRCSTPTSRRRPPTASTAPRRC